MRDQVHRVAEPLRRLEPVLGRVFYSVKRKSPAGRTSGLSNRQEKTTKEDA